MKKIMLLKWLGFDYFPQYVRSYFIPAPCMELELYLLWQAPIFQTAYYAAQWQIPKVQQLSQTCWKQTLRHFNCIC